jgi:hypothetical protein
MVLFFFVPKFPVLPFDVDCFLPQSLYLSKDYMLSRCECGRKAQSVCPSFSKLLKLYWTRADVSSLAWTQARILKNEAWRIHERVRTKVGQYKTSEAIQAILPWRLATYENDLFQNVSGEDERGRENKNHFHCRNMSFSRVQNTKPLELCLPLPLSVQNQA